MTATMERTNAGLYAPVPFARHIEQMRAGEHRWEQGDHILIAAPTKAGKTTLMRRLVDIRSHVVVLVTKKRDDTFADDFKGWTILEEWPKGGPRPYETKILLWPKHVRGSMAATIANQRRVFHDMLQHVADEGRRCVVFDECLYLSDPKYGGLATWISYLHYHGRSNKLTLVTLTQRPAWIPVTVYANITHAYIARTRDRKDQARLADLGGIDAKEVGANLSALPSRHDYVYLNPQGDAEPAIINTRT